MGSVNEAVDLELHGDIALILMNNPPVNALGFVLRDGLTKALAQAHANPAIKAIMLSGTDKAFSGGADITEFGKPKQAPSLHDVIRSIEESGQPVVAAIRGLALGGGLELALSCHSRIAWPGARVGLPEVKLGLLPGAGGTQRMPRLVGAARALEIIATGDPVTAERALADGIIDWIADGPFPGAAIAYARGLGPTRLVRDRDDKLAEAKADPGLLGRLAEPLIRRARDPGAVEAIAACVRAAVDLPFEAGAAEERRLFDIRLKAPESAAQRYAFFAERDAQKVPGIAKDTPVRRLERAVVIGAGTMGGGIAMSLAEADLPVTLVETGAEALEKGRARIRDTYEVSVKRGSLSPEESRRRQDLISGAITYDPVAHADVVIEAAFEEMAVKKQIFAELDRRAKPDAVLATNTSYLDLNEIAAATKRPHDVLGMHFFSPANVMKLVEIVRGAETSPETLATAIALTKRIGKIPVVVGVCNGFVGNRMLARRSAQAEALLQEGAWPADVDSVLTDFGFRMGPFAVTDLAGLDVSYRARKASGVKFPIADALCEAGRHGQKTGKGYFLYKGREATPDPEAHAMIAEISAKLGIQRRTIDRQEILERLIYPMINEGARILDEGIAARPSDIDVIWINGYAWPVFRGGPMWYADFVGLPKIRDRLSEYAKLTGNESLKPAPLLESLAAAGKTFASLASKHR